jgi:hypothetical protein
MRNYGRLDQNRNKAIHAEIVDRRGYLLSDEPSPPLDHIREQGDQVMRFQAMEQETTDPLAARLLQDMISEMEAELKEQVDRLVAERTDKVR